ncbi:MAG: hypothetical protein E6R05_04110 [Candidatus Moraniibacteriota bacterium]|nr:MAG: hypothetical protein E6R05_04110 [Candidatus Moranbacteria bacterium]
MQNLRANLNDPGRAIVKSGNDYPRDEIIDAEWREVNPPTPATDYFREMAARSAHRLDAAEEKERLEASYASTLDTAMRATGMSPSHFTHEQIFEAYRRYQEGWASQPGHDDPGLGVDQGPLNACIESAHELVDSVRVGERPLKEAQMLLLKRSGPMGAEMHRNFLRQLTNASRAYEAERQAERAPRLYPPFVKFAGILALACCTCYSFTWWNNLP